ncbi:MAG: R3H domain-containing nucleic acid-binding protein, partial [Pyramidobacter piscolens]
MEENILKTQDDEVLVLEVSSEDEARDRAASRWNIAREDVLLTVVGEEKKLFGLFGRKLKVEARRPSVPAAGPAKAAEADGGFVVLLKRVLKAADLDLEVNVQPDGSVNLSGPDSRILLAGRQGEGLKALDYIVNLMARNDGPAPHVRLDCEGFRRKREKDLERVAMDAAKEAMKTRRTVYLQPMSSWERRIVHLTLRESANVETHSIGVEPGRKVAVRLI